ncbi:hypothetical protein Pcinc_013350 [Petrolisthes cinctipes]|uniref:Uncharacterized protein n=1 Tax=Petrolisthes cinctipes TaxID=88211 RepID=A0AAE1G000_PETCI|nr:hypothetical protein Pcinc_013350 [Petrolisthes cinctipes]
MKHTDVIIIERRGDANAQLDPSRSTWLLGSQPSSPPHHLTTPAPAPPTSTTSERQLAGQANTQVTPQRPPTNPLQQPPPPSPTDIITNTFLSTHYTHHNFWSHILA